MGFTPAKPVTSAQTSIHKQLAKVVTKHLNSQCQKPIAAHNQAAFAQGYSYWQDCGKPKIILDSACGTGESSRYYAINYPQHLVIGLDQSSQRLGNSNNQQLPDNCLLLRCECSDFWRLAEQAQWQFEQHKLLYPNPYPKAKHLQRRWHGTAAFTSLLTISRHIELRTNWQIYAEEFYYALCIAHTASVDSTPATIAAYHPRQTISAFERKYHHSGHSLWQVTLGDNE